MRCLLGSTETQELASKGVSTAGAWWSATRVLSLVTLLGFSAATWALYQRSGWWEALAVGSAVLGVIALVPYGVAAYSSGETSPGFNILIHVLGSAGVLALLLIPALQRWVEAQVMSG